MKIIIYHHSLVYVDGSKIWFQSFFGAWVKELANQFSEIGILAESAQNKTDHHDYLVESPNITIYSIGFKGTQSRGQRSNSIKKWGGKLSDVYDYLIIRGITPRQYEVYKAFKNIKGKAFLMVGSLVDSKPTFGFSKLDLLLWYLNKLRLVQLKIISRGAKIFANSPKIVDEFKDILDIKSEFVPTNTISGLDFLPFQFKGFRQIPELLFCGRVVQDKGIEELIKAVGDLKEQNFICVLKIVGNVSDTYKKKLDEQINRLKIDEYVSFEGFINFGERLLEYFRQADMYILPSWHEGFPHSIWEASCSCTPIITTNVGGIPGLVSEEEVMFIKPKSYTEISKAVITMLANPGNSKELVRNAYMLAQEYTIENCAAILKSKLINN